MRLQDYLEKNGIRAGQLAKQAGIYPSVLYRYLSGERGMSLSAATKIVAASDGQIDINTLADKSTNGD